MGWSGTKTWAVSDTLTASDLNSYLRDNTAYLYQKAEVAMRHTPTTPTHANVATISYTAGTDDIFDQFAMHVSGSPTRLSVVSGQTGTYWCWATGFWATNTTGRRFLSIMKNGSDEIARNDGPTDPGGGQCWQSCGGMRNFGNVGDYTISQIEQESGGSLSFDCRGFGMQHLGS